MRGMLPRRVRAAPARVLLGAAAALLLGADARAEDQGVWFAGVDASSAADVSAYAGVTEALPGGALGRGWGLRPSLGTGRYDYEGGSGRRIDGVYLSGAVGLVHQESGSWGWTNLSIAPRAEQIWLSPKDLSNPRRGLTVDAVLQADGGRFMGPWRLVWYGAYGTGVEDHQVRIELTRTVSPGWRLGGEGGAQGDPTYERGRLGLVAVHGVGRGPEVRLSLGAAYQAAQGGQAYAGLAVSQAF